MQDELLKFNHGHLFLFLSILRMYSLNTPTFSFLCSLKLNPYFFPFLICDR